MREHWREIDYWVWLWSKRIPFEAKLAVAALVVVSLLAGGWFAAYRLTTAKASVIGTNDLVLQTTVQKVITVREHGKIVRKVVPVVKRVYLRPRTAFETKYKYTTRVLSAPGTVRIVKRVITTKVPVVRKEIVTVKGKTHTVVTTRLVPTTRIQTSTQTLTQTQTRVMTNQQTVTNTVPVTAPPTTIRKTETTTLPAVTVTKNETTTVPGPSQTVTDTTTVFTSTSIVTNVISTTTETITVTG